MSAADNLPQPAAAQTPPLDAALCVSGDPTLRLYAIVRSDLAMPPGKLASQAGHAFLEAFLASSRSRPEITALYAQDPPGTKVVLTVDTLEHLLEIEDAAMQRGLPTARVTDSGHVLKPHFDGSPIVTALGLGPASRQEVRLLTRRCALAR